MVGLMVAAGLAVSSQVTEVTVYSDRAQVVRTAQVELQQGFNTLRFQDLPEAIDSRGIQVDGAGAATVLDVRFKTENFEEIPQEAWQALYDERDRLWYEQAETQQRIQRLRELKQFLDRISEKVTHGAETEDPPELDPDQWGQMLDLYVDKGAEYDAGIRAAELELKRFRESLAKVEADITDTGAHTRRLRRVIEVDLEVPQAGPAAIRLSYLVSGPSWVPTYDVRVDTETRNMEMQYYALVRQSTGEDWNGVALKLSTANPGLGGKHPDLQPWRIALGSLPYESSMLSDVSMRYHVADNAYDVGTDLLASAGEVPAAPVRARLATVNSEGVSAVFEVKGDSTVEADNVEHRVAISREMLPAHFRYSAVPKMDRHAYLKAKAINSSEMPFLAGSANIFLDGSYVATSELKLVAPGQDFWVFLGADESIKVEYKLIQRYTSSEGLLSRKVRHTREYLIKVNNTHAVPEEVIIWDQIPISGNEEIQVDLITPKYSKDTDEIKIDEEKLIQWFRNVGPGDTWEIPLEFRVEAPRDVNIAGLD